MLNAFPTAPSTIDLDPKNLHINGLYSADNSRNNRISILELLRANCRLRVVWVLFVCFLLLWTPLSQSNGNMTLGFAIHSQAKIYLRI